MTHLPPLPDAASAPYPPHPAPIPEEQKDAARELAERQAADVAGLEASEARRKRAVLMIGVGLGSTVLVGATALGVRLYARFARSARPTPRQRASGDDKRKRGGPDRARVAAGEPYEVRYFARKHGISAAVAREIITEAGPDRKAANALALART